MRATTAFTFSTSQLPKVVRRWCVFSFWLGNVLRATNACTFLTSQLPKVVRDREFFTLLTWKCASRHNRVHFFDTSTSKSGPKMVCFLIFNLETCFAPQRRAIFHLSSGQLAPHPPLSRRPSRATNHLKKRNESRLSYLFVHLHLLSSHSFSSLIFSLLGFSSLTLPTSAFPSVHIVGSFTSKLPSNMDFIFIRVSFPNLFGFPLWDKWP